MRRAIRDRSERPIDLAIEVTVVWVTRNDELHRRYLATRFADGEAVRRPSRQIEPHRGPGRIVAGIWRNRARAIVNRLDLGIRRYVAVAHSTATPERYEQCDTNPHSHCSDIDETSLVAS